MVKIRMGVMTAIARVGAHERQRMVAIETQIGIEQIAEDCSRQVCEFRCAVREDLRLFF